VPDNVEQAYDNRQTTNLNLQAPTQITQLTAQNDNTRHNQDQPNQQQRGHGLGGELDQ